MLGAIRLRSDSAVIFIPSLFKQRAHQFYMQCHKFAIGLHSASHTVISGLDCCTGCVACTWARIRIPMKAAVELVLGCGGGGGVNPLDKMNINAVRSAIGVRHSGTLRLAQLLYLIE